MDDRSPCRFRGQADRFQIPSKAKELEELDGLVGLGMKSEALHLARQILRRGKLKAVEFNGALAAILIQQDDLNALKPLVEAAYARLPERDKRTTRSDMLGFYHSLKDWESAYRFLPGRANNALDLMFAMQTLLNLRKLEEAKGLQKKCLRMLSQPLDSFYTCAVLLALGSYAAQRTELETAKDYFGRLALNEVFAQNAWTAIIQIEAFKGLTQVWACRNQLKQFRQLGIDEPAIMLPGNRDVLFAELEQDLNRYEDALYAILPKEELWRYGWNTD